MFLTRWPLRRRENFVAQSSDSNPPLKAALHSADAGQDSAGLRDTLIIPVSSALAYVIALLYDYLCNVTNTIYSSP